MRWYGDGWGASSWVVMTLLWIALLVVAVWAAVRFLRGAGTASEAVATAPTPRSILDRRLASGEIDAEQYAQLRRLLDGSAAGSVPSDGPARP